MNVLVGCEESQIVTKAFRKRGHAAYSCDVVDTRGCQAWHYKQDVCEVIKLGWDLIILHPPCTAMAVSGNRWYGKGMPKHEEREKAQLWTIKLWESAIKYSHKVALENPVSTIWKSIKCSQYIQPWQFGHGEQKKTGLALHNLEPLSPTNIVEGREQKVWKMGPSKTRARDRSETYQGIADAMADQWGNSQL